MDQYPPTLLINIIFSKNYKFKTMSKAKILQVVSIIYLDDLIELLIVLLSIDRGHV